MVNKELFLTVKLSGNLKHRLEQLKKLAEEEIQKLKIKEDRTFLKYMICFNALGNLFLKKKDLTDEEKKEISRKCEGATYEEVKELWKRYMGFDWKGV